MFRNKFYYQIILFCSLSLAGCAAVVVTPTEINLVSAGEQSQKTIQQSVEVKFDTGYSRFIKANSRWLKIGQVSQGGVYKPINDVFTVEGSHIHEAYLIIEKDKLVGFYLPYERGVSLLKSSLNLSIQ